MVNFKSINISLGKFFVSLVACIGFVGSGIYWQAYETSQLKSEVKHLAAAIVEIRKEVDAQEVRDQALTIQILENKLDIKQIKGALDRHDKKIDKLNDKIIGRRRR